PNQVLFVGGDGLSAFGAHAIHSQESGNDDLLAGLRLHRLDVPMAPAHVLGGPNGQGRQGSVAGELLPDSLAPSAGVDAETLPVGSRQHYRVGLRQWFTDYRRSERREPGAVVSPLRIRVRRSRLSTGVQRVLQCGPASGKTNNRCFVR